jgi:hypothetical protein
MTVLERTASFIRVRDVEDTRSPSRVGAALGWWVVQVVLATSFFAHMFLSQLSIASCTETSCDYALYAATINTFNIGTICLLVAAAIGIYVLRRRGWAVVWSPIIGIVLSTALLAVTYAWSRAALELPLFGNRL